VILGINKRFLEFINISVITKITEVLPGQRTGVKVLPFHSPPPHRTQSHLPSWDNMEQLVAIEN